MNKVKEPIAPKMDKRRLNSDTDYMNENQYTLNELHIRLMTGDEHARFYTCQDILELIRNCTDSQLKLQLQSLVLPFLVDLQLYEDAIHCIESLLNQGEYRQQLSALFYKSKMYQDRGNFDESILALEQGMLFAKECDDKAAISQGYLQIAKNHMHKQSWDKALDTITTASIYAEEVSDYYLVAIVKYYTGLILYHLGHKELGMEKLRESSDLAYDHHSANIIMHTEAVRALYMLRNGKPDVAEEILTTWFNQFNAFL